MTDIDITVSGTASLQFSCGVCTFPIGAGSGYLCVDRAAAHRLHVERANDKPGSKTLAEILDSPDDVLWVALHQACDPDPEGPDYWIDVERAQTATDLLMHTAGLMGFRWLDATDWDDVITAAATAIGTEVQR